MPPRLVIRFKEKVEGYAVGDVTTAPPLTANLLQSFGTMEIVKRPPFDHALMLLDNKEYATIGYSCRNIADIKAMVKDVFNGKR